MTERTEAEREWLAEVGMRLRLARVRRRQWQDRLAELAVVSRVTLGNIERGEHAAGVLTYVRLARALGVSISMDQLLTDAP